MTMQKMMSSVIMTGTFVSSLVGLVTPQAVLAQAGTPTKLDTEELFGGTNKISNELGLNNTDIRVTIARIIRVAMGLLGIVAVVIVLIGGFTWMTAGGNDEKVQEAKKWIFAGIIGLAIILSAFAISTFVINSLVTATSGSGQATNPIQ
jgi:hypothetical protein